MSEQAVTEQSFLSPSITDIQLPISLPILVARTPQITDIRTWQVDIYRPLVRQTLHQLKATRVHSTTLSHPFEVIFNELSNV